MSVGKQLLFSVLIAELNEAKQEYLSKFVDSGVTREMFPNEDERRAFDFMMDYRTRYGVCPSLALVEVETDIRFPRYASQNPFQFWFDEFRKYVKHTTLIDLLDEVENHLADGRVDFAMERIGDTHARLRDLMAERKTSVTLAEIAPDIMERHHLLQIGAIQDGIQTGFPYLDEITGGVQPGDAWAIAGESSTGKTYILCRCALSAVNFGKKALFVSMEMPNMQIGRRSLAMGATVSANNIRLGRLSRFAVNQVRDFLHQWGTSADNRLVFVEGRVNYSVRDVKAKIMEYRPDVTFIDGAYMLRAGKNFSSRWEMNMEVMETLKQIAMEENIGIVATFQFDQKQKTKSVASIMGGQSIGQIASVVIGIENEADNGGYSAVSYKELTIYKGREGERAKLRVKYDMNRTSIEQAYVISGNSDLGLGLSDSDRGNYGHSEEF
jgi:replicative DNA helicase